MKLSSRACCKRRAAFAATVVWIAALAVSAPPARAAGPPPSYAKLFSLAGDFPLGARTNRTDYESIDPSARRLYIAKMGAGQLLVFDLDRNRLITALDGFRKITGVLAVPELHKVYASVPGAGLVSSMFVGLGMVGLSTGHGAVAIRDMRTLKEIARVPGGVFPDGIAFDGKERTVFVSDELGSALIAVDADKNAFTGRIDTGGEVGNVRYDALTARMYVPVQSNDELLAVDPQRRAVVARYPLPGCVHPHGFIVAPSAAVGYVACDGNDRLVAVGLAAGRVLANLPVAHDPDVLAIDPGSKRLYVAAESGNVSTYGIGNPAAPAALGDVFVANDAHTVAVDPASHRLYFALADVNGECVLRVLQPRMN
jgi:DNA-binding beta-propeller fold protein YncE